MITTNQVSIRLVVTSTSVSTLLVKVAGFTNPRSTCPITGIITSLVNSTGYTKDVYLTTSLSGFIANSLSSSAVSLSSSNQVVGASGVNL